MGDLRDAVTALTQPTTTKIEQADGVWTSIRHDPLLVQLDNAIRSSIGGTMSGASLAFERNLLDNDALYAMIKIGDTIRAWCRLEGVKPVRVPLDDLLAWHKAKPDAGDFYIDLMVGWAETIRAKVERRKSFDVTTPCPACGASTWADETGEYTFPVHLTYVEAFPFETVAASCRAADCLAEWSGVMALRLLRAQIGDDPAVLLAFLHNQA